MIDLDFARRSPFGMGYLFGHMTKEEAIQQEAQSSRVSVAMIKAKYRRTDRDKEVQGGERPNYND